MEALAFYRLVTMDHAALFERLVEMLEREKISYCLIGGQAVNAYVEPLVSLDLDIVVAENDRHRAIELLRGEFEVTTFAHTVNVSSSDSGIRAQIQTDPRYLPFTDRASHRDVLGFKARVAAIDDLLQGKIWAALDPERRPSKRQKDLADIARILEAFPELRARVPREIVARLE